MVCEPITQVTLTAPADVIHRAVAIRKEVLRNHPDVFDPTFCISEGSLRILVALLAKARPLKVLELGSGLSTLVIGSLREVLGVSTLVSVDHWETWQRKVATLFHEQLSVEFVNLPLARTSVGGLSGVFYDGIVERCSKHAPFDAVIIDGPPELGDTGNCNRAMASSMFRHLLRPGTMIVLDDALRETEQQAATVWLNEGFVASWRIVDCDRAVGYGYVTNV